MIIEKLSTRLSVSKLQLQQTLCYYSSFIVIATVGASIGPLLPWLADQTAVSLSVISAVFIVRPFGTMLGAWAGGYLFDRYQPHQILMFAVLALGGFTALIPFAFNFYLLLTILLFTGIFASALNVGGNILTMRVHGLRSAPFVNALHFVFSSGALLSPLIIAVGVKLTEGIAVALLFIGVMTLFPAYFFFRTPGPQVEATNAAKQPVVNRPFLVTMIVVFYFFIVGADIGFGGWIYTYGLKTGIGDKVSAAYLTSLYWVAQASGRFIAIPVATRVRPSLMILTGVMMAIATSVVMQLSPANANLMWPATFLLGFSIGPLFASMLAYARNILNLTGQITGRFFIGASLGAMAIPWIIGQFFEIRGPVVVLQIVFIDLLLTLATFLVIRLVARRVGRKPVVPGIESID